MYSGRDWYTPPCRIGWVWWTAEGEHKDGLWTTHNPLLPSGIESAQLEAMAISNARDKLSVWPGLDTSKVKLFLFPPTQPGICLNIEAMYFILDIIWGVKMRRQASWALGVEPNSTLSPEPRSRGSNLTRFWRRQDYLKATSNGWMLTLPIITHGQVPYPPSLF
jgi:hypothetical protein